MQDQSVVEVMRRSRLWVQLTGLSLFASAAMALFAVVDALTGGEYLSFKQPSTEELIMSVSMAVANLVFEVILGYALIVYASRINAYLVSAQSEELERALNASRQFWKTAGIYAIVMIVAMVVMMIFMAMMTYNALQGVAH